MIFTKILLFVGLVALPGYSQLTPEDEEMIVNKINAYRSDVEPPASNMEHIVSRFIAS